MNSDEKSCATCGHQRPGYCSDLCAAGDRKPIDTVFARDPGGICGPSAGKWIPRKEKRRDHKTQ